MRIDIVGLPASGKSTLAELISKKLAVPYIQLDDFWFQSGGLQGRSTTPNIEQVQTGVREKVLEALKQASWVSDGTYLHVQDLIAHQANTIIFLDIPLWKRLINHTKRMFFGPKKHSHLTFWDDLTFYRELIKRNFSSGPKLRVFIKKHQSKVIVLKSEKEVDAYLNNL